MLTYRYDGSLEGFFSVFAHTAETGESPGSILSVIHEKEDLFSEERAIPTNPDKALAFAEHLKRSYPQNVFHYILLAFLSEEIGSEMLAYYYYRNVLEKGPGIITNYSDPKILGLRKLTNRVSFEVHRLQGLIRFQKLMDGTYYAPIEPDHNVLQLLVYHFTRRFKNQKWVIHDRKRGTALIYDGKDCNAMELDFLFHDNPESIQDPEEKRYQELWRGYFKAIAITERKNPKLQKRLMPKRYWKYLTEIDLKA